MRIASPEPLQIDRLSGFDAWKAHVSTLMPIDGSNELWVKAGHGSFIQCEFNPLGRFAGSLTKLRDENDPKSRVKTRNVRDVFTHLSFWCQENDGGAFYIPGQPIGGFPTKDGVNQTYDLGFEFDSGTLDEQLEKIQAFCCVSGLSPATLLASGGKSIQGHVHLDRPHPAEDVMYLKRLLVIGLMSDPVTVRPHQPMRIAGFYRKEKDRDQELLFYSYEKYSYEAILEGFAKWFEYLGLAMPDCFTDDWWVECFHTVLKGSANLTDNDRFERIKDSLTVGLDAWEESRRKEQERREMRRQQRLARCEVEGEQISDVVEETCIKLGESAFTLAEHNWKTQGAHTRGLCSFHDSKSGNSAWIAPAKSGDGSWCYHCTACTDDKPIDAFRYWLYTKNGFGYPYPIGKQYVDEAKAFLDWAGVELPDHLKGGNQSKLRTAAKARSTGARVVESVAVEGEADEGVTEQSSRVAPDEDLDEEFTQKVVRRLYSATPWICVANELYRWTGNHYKRSPDEVELKRIQELANNFCYEKKGRVIYPYAKPSAVKSALEWAKIRFAVLPEECNPSGLNCINGVLVRKGESDFELYPHSPDRYFLYEPMAKFDPDAPAEDCDRLLSALDEGQQQVLLRTIAAALDIDMVRRKHGRLVRAILAKGVGNNGKDAHREVVSLLWGRTGMASCAFEDFQQYDDGRKFPIIGLMNACVNWASENKKSVNLDSLQSLKRTITGDTLHYERKGKDTQEFTPQCVSIFNVNDVPNLKAGLEAIKSRFAVVSYNKVYRKGADPSRGEIEADPRFKYDPDFMRENVLPAFLNKVIQAFKDLMNDGIDYSCCDKALEEIQIHNSHLFEFALETGLVFDPDSEIPVDDLWKRLEAWYKDTGVLTIEYDGMKERRIWADPIRPGDLYIKGANQIVQRFTNLYPQAKKISLGKNRQAIKGLKFADPKSLVPAVEDASPPEPQSAEAAEAKAVQTEQISSSEDNPALIARYTIAFKQAVQMTGASQLDIDQCLIQLLEEMKPLPLEVHQGVWDELPNNLRKRIQFQVLKKRPDLARSK